MGIPRGGVEHEESNRRREDRRLRAGCRDRTGAEDHHAIGGAPRQNQRQGPRVAPMGSNVASDGVIQPRHPHASGTPTACHLWCTEEHAWYARPCVGSSCRSSARERQSCQIGRLRISWSTASADEERGRPRGGDLGKPLSRATVRTGTVLRAGDSPPSAPAALTPSALR